MRQVTIDGKEYALVYNLKGLFVYEEITGHPYTGAKTVDTYLLMYAVLLANNEDFCLSFDEFIGACDKDLGLFSEFVDLMTEESKRVAAFQDNKKKAASL